MNCTAKLTGLFQLLVITVFLMVSLTLSCQEGVPHILQKDNLTAWCIVPFDSLERTPAERIAMLKDLGLSQYAYDWRVDDLDDMAEELELAKANGIKISAVWLWIDGNADAIDSLSAPNERVLKIIADAGLKTDIWLGFHHNFFSVVHHTARVAKGSRMIRYIADKVEAIDCRLVLYNHGDWFGEPENQIKIIEKLDRNIGIVYSFHHGHHQIDRFPSMVEHMLPYLWTVNINGMDPDDSKILTVGSGKYEGQMIQTLIDAGYEGPIGVLGHVNNADVKQILKANLDGLRTLQFSE